MKLIDVSNENLDLISMIKTIPKSKVKIYDTPNKDTRFIYEWNEHDELLSISCPGKTVSEGTWVYGINRFMRMRLVDAQITIKPSGVVFITEKPKSFPRIANCTF